MSTQGGYKWHSTEHIRVNEEGDGHEKKKKQTDKIVNKELVDSPRGLYTDNEVQKLVLLLKQK